MSLEVNGQDLTGYVEGVVTTDSLDGEEKAPAIFVPHELKTIEVDIEKKIFKVNGEEFGHGCTGFSISCDGCDDYTVRMEIETTVIYAAYDGIRRVAIKGHPAHRWTPSGITVCENEREDISYSGKQLLKKLYGLFLHVFDSFFQ